MEDPTPGERAAAQPERPRRLEAFALRHRLLLNVCAHVLLFALGLLLAFLVRFDIVRHWTADWLFRSYLPWLPYFVILKLLIFWAMKLLRGGWQYTGIRDVVNILIASWLFMCITYPLVLLFRAIPHWTGHQVLYMGSYLASYSQGVLALDFMGTVFLLCAARLGFRIYREELRPVSAEGLRRVLIVGAGNAAEAIIREIRRMRVERYRVIGLVDDEPARQGLFIHGAPVLGTTDRLGQICQDEEIDEIIIAMPSATHRQLRRVIELCSGTKLKFQSLPSVSDLIDGRVTVSQIRPVDINDLLGRQEVELDTEAIRRFLHGRRVLVTGAGGSIGAEMCRQVCKYAPAGLILVEQAENPLFEIHNELSASFPELPIAPVICDIYDRARVGQVWRSHHPEVVIHAAAHKHVPLMEQNPCEAIKNNILGTKNVADASCQHGVSEFVLISTDKAVNPSSVMGATKRVAEIYTQSLSGWPGCKTQFKAVRFGNVLGSAGSVVPIFRKQIAEGGPVRVTDPEMRRYFMTIPEASQLVVQAAATGQDGQIYLLDMGEPIKIVDLARQMITLSGFRPDEDIKIAFTGIRPGEKLFEELRTEGEHIEKTVHPKILVWKHRPMAWPSVQEMIEEISQLQSCNDWEKIVSVLQRYVPEYHGQDRPAHPKAVRGGPADATADKTPGA